MRCDGNLPIQLGVVVGRGCRSDVSTPRLIFSMAGLVHQPGIALSIASMLVDAVKLGVPLREILAAQSAQVLLRFPLDPLQALSMRRRPALVVHQAYIDSTAHHEERSRVITSQYCEPFPEVS